MPDKPAILDDIDSGFEQWIPVIKDAQKNYYKNNGRYWQGLWTHSEPPSGEVEPDNLDNSPTDQSSSWDDIVEAGNIDFPSTMISRIAINVFQNIDGHGYTMVVERQVSSDTWRKTITVQANKEDYVEDWFKLSNIL